MDISLVTSFLDRTDTVYEVDSSTSLTYVCQVCGDYKYRGGLKIENDSAYMNCFNCEGVGGLSLYDYLDSTGYKDLAKEYLRSIRREKINKKSKNDINLDLFKEKDAIIKNDGSDFNEFGLPLVQFTDLCYSYRNKNNEDEKFFHCFYDVDELSEEAIKYLENERGFTKEDYKNFKFCKEKNDIIMPFYSNEKENMIYGFQSRNIYDKKFHNQFFKSFDLPSFKFYNLENLLKLPKDTKIYIFESIFDGLSSGLKNWGAIIGSSMSEEVYKILKDYNLIFCFDADNTGFTKSLIYAEKGYSVLVHEKDFKAFKDFNKLLELGESKESIREYILSNINTPKLAIVKLKKMGITLEKKRGLNEKKTKKYYIDKIKGNK